MNPKKIVIARLFELMGLNSLLHSLQDILRAPFIRAINYHDVPPSHSEAFERQVQFYAEHFVSVDYAALQKIQRGEWDADKPGLIISFDDGLRSQAEVACPLLEKYGFVGWFFVPLGFIETPVAAQAVFARSQRIQYADEFSDGRIAMSLEELSDLARRHVIGCHTHSHCRLGSDLSPDILNDEVQGAKHRLEECLGYEVSVFCWVGSEEEFYSREAARIIRQSAFRFSFMTNNDVIRYSTDSLQLQRTNIEASYPLSLIRFQLSGCMDLLYSSKRRRVNRLTGGSLFSDQNKIDL